jgi:hypothetical protein
MGRTCYEAGPKDGMNYIRVQEYLARQWLLTFGISLLEGYQVRRILCKQSSKAGRRFVVLLTQKQSSGIWKEETQRKTQNSQLSTRTPKRPNPLQISTPSPQAEDTAKRHCFLLAVEDLLQENRPPP